MKLWHYVLIVVIILSFANGAIAAEVIVASTAPDNDKISTIQLVSEGIRDFEGWQPCIRTDNLLGIRELTFLVNKLSQEVFQEKGNFSVIVEYFDNGNELIEVGVGDEINIRKNNLLGTIARNNTKQWKQTKLSFHIIPKVNEMILLTMKGGENSELYIKGIKLITTIAQKTILADFEKDIELDVYAGNGCNGFFTRTESIIRNGNYSGKFGYDFTHSGIEFSGKWVGYVFPESRFPKVIEKNDQIAFWVKADGEPYRLYITIIDSTSKKYAITRKTDGSFIMGSRGADWTYVTFALPGEAVYPVRLDNITIDKVGESANSQTAGAFYIDDIVIIKGENS